MALRATGPTLCEVAPYTFGRLAQPQGSTRVALGGHEVRPYMTNGRARSIGAGTKPCPYR
jgi:hypothetical protein